MPTVPVKTYFVDVPVWPGSPKFKESLEKIAPVIVPGTHGALQSPNLSYNVPQPEKDVVVPALLVTGT
jgi:hypothetical protein